MKYAVVEIKGKQYKVMENDELLVDLISGDIDYRVLLLVGEDEFKLGKPELDKKLVTIKKIEDKVMGEKLSVLKYKAKSRYRKKIGFRPIYTKLQVVKVG